ATVEQLITLPGVGQSKAKAIIKYREEVGPFLEVAQLTQVKGIGEKMLNKIEGYVQVR
ncbi:MAG: competence protein, partial [Alteromonas sp.]|nr:competence protein [Alteromonas sp.]